MKMIILFTCALGIMVSSYAQILKPKNQLSGLTKLDLRLPGIGLTFVPWIGNSVTTDLSFGFGGGYNIFEGSLDYDVIKPALYFSATPKIFL